MIRKLQKKLILLAMGALILLLVIIVGSSNFLSFNKVTGEADTLIAMLEENRNHMFDDTAIKHGVKDDSLPRFFNQETPYETRFFSVTLDADGTFVSAAMDRIASVTEEEAKNDAAQVLASNNEYGFLSQFRYHIQKNEETTKITFLDCSKDLDTFFATLALNCGISLGGLVVVFLLLVAFSRHIVKPVAESYEKQKQFISYAGHELKTPLTIISADSEVLQMELGENEWVEDICHQTERMAELTNSLLQLSRMEEGCAQYQMIDMPLSDIIEETVQSFQILAQNQGRHICAAIEPMLSVCGDEKSLRQLIGILLDNAIKYADGEGDIQINLKRSGHSTCIEVSNPVKNVEEKQLKQYFDRFYRGDVSRNSEISGFGLGLSIAKAIVDAHKGKISVNLSENHRISLKIVFL